MIPAGIKVCTTCGIGKPRDAFHNKAATKDGKAPQCKDCVRVTNAAWKARNPASVAAAYTRWRKRHPQTVAALKARSHRKNPVVSNTRASKWRAANPLRARAIVAAWKRANPAAVNEASAERKAARRHATPAWANKFFISEIYELAQLRTKALGYPWHVDHIVPLVNPRVQGLHVEHNLRVVPSTVNLAKGNRAWPDMPMEAHG